VKKTIVYILASMLLYSFFQELDALKVFYIVLGLAAAYGISRLPVKVVSAAKYPVILLSFAGTAAFFIYPNLAAEYPVEPVITFLCLYGIAFFLITLEEKGMNPYKEAIALSILFLSCCFNLAMAGKPLLILPLAFSVIFFLFILGRGRLILLVGGYALVITIVLIYQKFKLLGGGIPVREVNQYILFAASFILLVISFFGFVKRGGQTHILAFFGFLFVCTDLMLSTGLRLSGGLLYQPIIALAMVSPLIGLMLKSEGKKV
jgi:hypothetical protein